MAAAAARYPKPTQDPPRAMTIDDLAAYLQIAKSILYKLAQEGKVPGQKVGKHWRFSRVAVEEWLKRWDQRVSES